MRRVAAMKSMGHVVRWWRACEKHCVRARVKDTCGWSTSWILGISRSSAKTNTPGAEVASWMSFAAAAPFADFDISRKGSSFAAKFVPSSMVNVVLVCPTDGYVIKEIISHHTWEISMF